MSVEAFKKAVRETMDELFEATARENAKFLTGEWCPTEERIQELLPYCRAVLLAECEGRISSYEPDEDD